jgi:haemagglutination activity domain
MSGSTPIVKLIMYPLLQSSTVPMPKRISIESHLSLTEFLINPNGIIFGDNARLDIGGSFAATTASVKFPDGSEFGATNTQALPLLKINITPGLQYRVSQPGATIKNSGNLAPFFSNFFTH